MTKGNDGRQMHKNSLANLSQNKPLTAKEDAFADTFNEDMISLWTKLTDGEKLEDLVLKGGEDGSTIGQALLLQAAIKSPMSFAKMASSMAIKKASTDPVKKALDFAETLQKLNKRMNKVQGGTKDTDEKEIIDINVLDEKKLPL